MPLVSVAEFSDLVVAFAALGTFCVALYGLRAWQIQAEWRENRSVARDLLRGVVRVRDAFQMVRSSMIFASEFPENWDPANPSPRYKQEAFGHVYQSRLEPLRESVNLLEDAVLEAEVLWGSGIVEHMRGVRFCRSRLVRSIQDHLAHVGMDADYHDNPTFRDRVNRDINGPVDDEDDELTTKIRESLSALAGHATPHLRRDRWCSRRAVGAASKT